MHGFVNIVFAAWLALCIAAWLLPILAARVMMWRDARRCRRARQRRAEWVRSVAHE